MAELPEMESPLISEEGSSRTDRGDGRDYGGYGNSNSSDGWKWKVFHRRSDAIAYGTRYQKAAALVDLAEDGIGLPMEVLNDARFERAIRFYFLYTRLDLLWSLNLFALILLNFLEVPLWCPRYGDSACHDKDVFFLGQMPYLNRTQSLIYEGVTLLILVLYTFFPISFEGCHLFWKNNLNKLKVVLLLVLVCDLLVYAVLFNAVPLRIAPYIRVVFLCLTIKDLRSCFVTLAGMTVEYLNIVALSLLFLLFSSWLAYVTFEDTLQGKTLFSSFGLTFYQMLVLFTTSNNPDAWVPAYKASRWSAIFFVIYVLLGVFFVTNLILAVVYDSFKAQLAKQVAEMDSMRKSILEKAFSLLDNHNLGYLNKEQCIHLFDELNKYRTLPTTSREDFELIFNELDDSGDFKINMEEFADLCNAIALRFQKEPSPSWFEQYPSFYHSPSCERLKEFVRSNKFEYVIMFVLILNLVAVIIETALDIEDSSQQKVWQKVEFVFGWVYVVEMALKIFSLGFDRYWMKGENKFDFVVTWVIVIGETLSFALPSGLPFLSNGEWIRYLLLARMLRLLRILLLVRSYRAFVATFLTLIPSLMPYLGTIFCFMCIYCSLGTQIFGGIVNSGNPGLEATDLYSNEYVYFNFNDYPNGMVTLFNLLVMGNWHMWVQSYWDLTGTAWTVLYFISFYLITVLLLLNLIVSFVLEAFFAELELEKSDEPEEQKGDHGGKMRRRLTGVKSRSRNVDILLHHMLSSELSKTKK